MHRKKQSLHRIFYYCLRSTSNHRVVLGAVHGSHANWDNLSSKMLLLFIFADNYIILSAFLMLPIDIILFDH